MPSNLSASARIIWRQCVFAAFIALWFTIGLISMITRAHPNEYSAPMLWSVLGGAAVFIVFSWWHIARSLARIATTTLQRVAFIALVVLLSLVTAIFVPLVRPIVFGAAGKSTIVRGTPDRAAIVMAGIHERLSSAISGRVVYVSYPEPDYSPRVSPSRELQADEIAAIDSIAFHRSSRQSVGAMCACFGCPEYQMTFFRADSMDTIATGTFDLECRTLKLATDTSSWALFGISDDTALVSLLRGRRM